MKYKHLKMIYDIFYCAFYFIVIDTNGVDKTIETPVFMKEYNLTAPTTAMQRLNQHLSTK